MKKLSAVVTLLIVIVTIIAFIPALAQGTGPTVEKVPMITVDYVQMGNGPFKSMEQFQIHSNRSVVKSTSNSIDLSFQNSLVSPINDTLSLNQSIHLSKNQITEDFPVGNGTYKLIIPPQQSYLNSISIDGNSSYKYITIVESIPTGDVIVNGTFVNSTRQIENLSIYNLTMDYGGSSFVLHSPGMVYVGGILTKVVQSINVPAGGGITYISFSFPVSDGSFKVIFNQVLSSSQQINNDVLSYYQINSGFQSPFLQNLLSNSVSIA
ncbi:MAG: hypothetical protein QXU18_05365, partial [Thermoplasmatales archaeon]